MKGLLKIPNTRQLKQAYQRLQHPSMGEKSRDEKALALYFQWARLDPRLAEITVRYISNNWKIISPVQFNFQLLEQPWPASAGVLLGYVELLIKKDERKLFQKWGQLVLHSIQRVSDQSFFIGQRSFGSKLLLQDAMQSNKIYQKWGFLGSENLIRIKIKKTILTKTRRNEALRELLKIKPRISVSDYILYLEGQITRRQAQYDLKNSKLLKQLGATRGCVYLRK